ncbi:MAG: hypothetical protein ACKOCT_04585, partial [Alphaproteobacteria bacterium]
MEVEPKPARVAISGGAAERAPIERRKILVIEDEPDILEHDTKPTGSHLLDRRTSRISVLQRNKPI